MGEISVIVPIYGTEKYVGKCLSSILHQTYSELEILAVNDGSRDGSKGVVLNLATADCFSDMEEEVRTSEYEVENKDIQIKMNIETDSKEQVCTYLSIDADVYTKKYFYILDRFVQEILYDRDNVKAYGDFNFTIDQYRNIAAVEKFAVETLQDEVTIEIRDKSYAIASKSGRIKYIEHYQNEGLFQARLTGYEYAKGEYIATVDSDDYIGIDYFRLMQKKAEETGADVVISEMIRENLKTGYKGKRTHAMNAMKDLDLCGTEIVDYLFHTEGELSPLWFVCGKLYKKALWDKCYADFLLVEGHHIMLEDMMYGTVFSLNAEHYVYCDADTYFYVVNDTASTANNGPKEKLYKNINDVLYAFDYIERLLVRYGVYEKYSEKLNRFKAKWSRTWYRIQKGYELTSEEREAVLDKLTTLSFEDTEDTLEDSNERDVFFYRTCTPWDSRIEMLKKKIVKKEVISFDIFDTLVVRPFFKPSDLFVLLNDVYKQHTDYVGIPFSDMRVMAERRAREELNHLNIQFEDITIYEIYEQMQKIYGVSEETAEYMLAAEMRLEIQMCQPRKKLKEIYDLAKALRKRIVFVSDMYLPKDTILSILENCGYQCEDNLYLSSELRVTKATGWLFRKMLDSEKVEAEQCIHIGDNWESDGEAAKKVGIEPWRTAKTVDLFMNNVADYKKQRTRGEYGALLYRNLTGSFMRYSQALDYLGIRCMLAVIANRIFDNPYCDWEPNTDFNRSPYNVGYMALGMHDYGIAQWLIKNVNKQNKIFFVARDGYLAMKIYQVIKERNKDIPDYEYFYMSRKSFLPLSIEKPADWWTVKDNINYIGKTPRQILAYYEPILPEYRDDIYEDIFRRHGILMDVPLSEESHYINFITAIQTKLHSQNIIDRYRHQMKHYLSKVFRPGDVMFDIGYSGRAQAILSKLLGYGIQAYYIHTLNEKSDVYAKEYDFTVNTFFDYSPALSGKIRELVQSDSIPSCIGYHFEQGKLQPVLEDKEWRFHEKYVIEQMHRGAVEFVRDFLDIFDGYIERMTYRKTDISFMHEKFILLPKKADMEIFELFHFEDELFFNKEYEKKWLVDIWNGDLKWNHLPSYEFKRGQSTKQTGKERTTVSVEKYKYVPYKLTPNPPKGLAKKLKYFKKNDHIILKKYMYEKGTVAYRCFTGAYNMLAAIKCRIKGENRVGNSRLDYSLSKTGKILYNATSAYGLLCCIVHKLTFYPNEPADLMLSSWRKDKYEDTVNAGFFEKVFIWNDMKYRDVSYAMDKVLQNASKLDKLEQEYRFFGIYEKLIPFKICDYKSIIIHGNSMPFGDFLERNEVPYSIIEDGAGLFCDYTLLQHFIDTTYPLIEQYMIKKYRNLQGGDYCEKIYINYAAQKHSCDDPRTIDFAPVALIDKLSSVQKRKIFQIYGVHEASEENKKKTCLLLTYPLAQREKFTLKEEKMCYALLADIFGSDCDEIHIKAHPDDRTDFTEIEGLTIVDRNVLSELLWYEQKTVYEKAYATVSTSTNNLLCAKKKRAFDTKFCEEYKYLFRYYVATMLMGIEAQKENRNITVSGVGVFDDLLEAMVEQCSTNCFYSREKTIEKAECLIVKDADCLEKTAGSKKTIMLNPSMNKEKYRRIILRKRAVKNYDFLNLSTEELYISDNFCLELPITIDMKITGIQVQICEDLREK